MQAYADQRLEKLHSAEQNYVNTVNALEAATIQTLQKGKVPDFDFQRHKQIHPDAQKEMVRQYLDNKLQNSPEVFKALDAIRREGAVVGVALDIGMVHLQRGQAMTDPDARKKSLEQAEKTFLAVRGSAGKTDEFRLNLGQVYYWLGKHAEARKLFDELLTDKGRDGKTLTTVGYILRQVGAESEARVLLEEGFNKETDPRAQSRRGAIAGRHGARPR